ncbi:ArsB/NhaD family transporter [Paenibacillus sp. OAS669]|uniref:ArsB/NhaD family transporter n=1 Tax=Paenibacillus sp. OAS669 TaxID=2663821 RepID=UPI00178AD9AF|nr:ArsB/NhaD family transporter [Paenibacillus sp. OAS669]MBE1443440.1 Na+/H+ antiporter NhaD/arsenite permease-like protein [Paenibacillus sp. OAS669]
MNTIQSASLWQMVASALIFMIAYGLIQTGLIRRAYIAWGGAVLVLILGLVDWKSAYQTHIAWETVLLLFGMMLLSGITGRTGIVQYLAVKFVQKGNGNPSKLLVLLAVIAAAGSAVLDPVTVLIVLVPVTVRIAAAIGVSPIPLIMTEMLCGNIGGSATLIGSLPNMMIGSSKLTGLTFNGFLLHVAPLSVILFAVSLFVLHRMYTKEWRKIKTASEEWRELDAAASIKDRSLVVKTTAVWGLAILGFLFHKQMHISVAIIAIAAALVLILLTIRKKEELEDVFHTVEWGTLFFLIGLFVLAGGLVNTGVIEAIAVKGMELTSGNEMFVSILVLWVAGFISAGVDQAPLVAAMLPLIKNIGAHMHLANDWELNPVWWSLAIGASIGGGATLIGSHANLVAAGLAMKEGHEISFMGYMKTALPLTLLLLVLSTGYIMWMYF